MLFIVYSIIFFVSCKIIFSKNEYVLLWFLVGNVILSNEISLFNSLHMTFFLALVYFISMLIRRKKYVFSIKNILWLSVVLYIGIFILVGFFDERLSVINKFVYPFRKIATTICIFICSYYFMRGKTNIKLFTSIITYLLIFIFLYAVVEFITQYNVVKNVTSLLFMGSQKPVSGVVIDDFGRFRASSVVGMSFNYGYVSAVFGLWLLYAYQIERRTIYIVIAIVCGFGGTLLSGCRTPIACCILAYLFLILSIYSLKQKIIVVLLMICGIIGILMYFPILTNLFFSIMDALLGGDNYVGSSTSMRWGQMDVAMKLFWEHPFLGHGINYFVENCGFGAGKIVYEDLWGMESIIFELLIENGLLGLLAFLIFFLSLIWYLLKAKHVNKYLSILGLSYILLFLTFSIATGVLGAWPYTMFFLGIIIAVTEETKYA